MRISVKVRDLRKGDLAFLPYWGRLLKARITKVSEPRPSVVDGSRYFVFLEYDTLSEPPPRTTNLCIAQAENEYEVYRRT